MNATPATRLTDALRRADTHHPILEQQLSALSHALQTHLSALLPDLDSDAHPTVRHINTTHPTARHGTGQLLIEIIRAWGVISAHLDVQQTPDTHPATWTAVLHTTDQILPLHTPEGLTETATYVIDSLARALNDELPTNP